MYEPVANTDSEVVFLGLALDHGRRSLANGTAALRSTLVASPGSTTVAVTPSVMKSGFGMSELLRFSESLCTPSSNWRTPLRHVALAGSCPHDILNQHAPIVAPSTRVSSPSSLHVEFLTANSDQEAG